MDILFFQDRVDQFDAHIPGDCTVVEARARGGLGHSYKLEAHGTSLEQFVQPFGVMRMADEEYAVAEKRWCDISVEGQAPGVSEEQDQHEVQDQVGARSDAEHGEEVEESQSYDEIGQHAFEEGAEKSDVVFHQFEVIEPDDIKHDQPD